MHLHYIFLLLAEERLPISLYWDIIMRHPYPLVLSQGLIELKHHGILTTEFFLIKLLSQSNHC